jgi:hypothetical protein
MRETTIDKNGVYEIYDLQAEEYLIEQEFRRIGSLSCRFGIKASVPSAAIPPCNPSPCF